MGCARVDRAETVPGQADDVMPLQPKVELDEIERVRIVVGEDESHDPSVGAGAPTRRCTREAS